MKILICGLIIGLLILLFISCSVSILPLWQLKTETRISLLKNSGGMLDIGVSEEASSIKMQNNPYNLNRRPRVPVNSIHASARLGEFDADLLKQLCSGI